MSQGMLITGASGLLGQALLRALPGDAAGHLFLLTRQNAFPVPAAWSGRVTFLSASLLQPERYESALRQCDTVLHLAAQTGKARPAVFRKVNVDGTRQLLAAASRAGIRRFLAVSSIAAGFADTRHYPYARSKAEAERLVLASGLRSVIVRPTMIAGPGSPVFQGLARLASLPVSPRFGSGQNRVQPVAAADVARVIAAVVAGDRFAGETIAVGGPGSVPVAELLDRLALRAGGRKPPTVSLPAAPVASLLALLEPLLLPLLPVTAGQLQTFIAAGTAPGDPLVDSLRPSFQSLETMIDESIPPPATPLDRECDTFTRYLIGTRPSASIQAHYRAFHQARGLPEKPGGFDAVLTRLARGGVWATRLADSFGRFFASRSLLRHKLVGLLAILETSPDTFNRIDRPAARGGWFSFLFGAAWRAAITVLCVAGGMILLFPLWLILPRNAGNKTEPHHG